MKFLTSLWASARTDIYPFNRAEVLLFTLPSKQCFFPKLEDLRKFSEDDFKFLEDLKGDIYFGLGLRKPGLGRYQRGGKESIVAIPAFAIDIDLQCDEHKANNLPRTDADVASILDLFPKPSFIVFTGHGYHCYWRFKEPIVVCGDNERNSLNKAFGEFQDPIRAKAKEFGWHIDSTATIDRIWRLPGYKNYKNINNKKEVECLSYSDVSYSLEELVSTISTSSVLVSKDFDYTKIRDALSKLSNPKHNKLFEKILKGESFAPRGERDCALNLVCSILAFTAQGKGKATELVEILRPSLLVWANEENASLTIDQEIEKAIDKLSRAQADFIRSKEELQSSIDSLGSFFDTSYQPGDFDKNKIILQCGSNFFIFNFKKWEYEGPHPKDHVWGVLKQSLTDSGVKLPIVRVGKKDGHVTPFTLNELIYHYGTIIKRTVADNRIIKANLDNKILYYPVSTMDFRLKPIYHERIDMWLKEFAGDKKDLLLDWLAIVPDINRQCSALALIGPPGTGKSLLMSGISRLWYGKRNSWDLVSSSFNSGLLDSPLVYVEEGIRSRCTAVTLFRELTAASQINIHKKFCDPFELHGHFRVVIAANEDIILSDILGTRELSKSSLDAVSGRLAYISVCKDAADFLNSIKKTYGPKEVKNWIDLYIAEHVLWLKENRKVDLLHRFGVSSEPEDIHSRLVARYEKSELVLLLLVRILQNIKIFDDLIGTDSTSFIGKGNIHINASDLSKVWNTYMEDSEQKLNVISIGKVLANFSTGKFRRKVGDKKFRAYGIDPKIIYMFAEQHMLYDSAELNKVVNR